VFLENAPYKHPDKRLVFPFFKKYENAPHKINASQRNQGFAKCFL